MADPGIGDPAPVFTLPDQDGSPVSLKDLEGQRLVLYFYPGDFTLGCTREACKFRDTFDEIRSHDARLVGVSQDPPDKHERFRSEHDLPFTLLSDEDGTVAESYGADGFFGTRRVTFIIGPDGTIEERIASPLPASHIKTTLAHLEDTVAHA